MADTPPIPVIQADRDAAAAFVFALDPNARHRGDELGDSLPIVQAFAAHRIAATDELLGVLVPKAQSLLSCLAQCAVTSGVCCCGDDMERHGSPMNCGHTPVDSGAYYTEQAVEELRATIAKFKGDTA